MRFQFEHQLRFVVEQAVERSLRDADPQDPAAE